MEIEENPLDIWDKLLAHATENKAPAPDDLFRFKFHGLFYVAPAQDSFMLRLRVPGSILSTHQLRGLADLAAECGSGRVDITTRSNLQIREFQPKDIVRVLNANSGSWHVFAWLRRRQHPQYHRLARSPASIPTNFST